MKNSAFLTTMIDRYGWVYKNGHNFSSTWRTIYFLISNSSERITLLNLIVNKQFNSFKNIIFGHFRWLDRSWSPPGPLLAFLLPAPGSTFHLDFASLNIKLQTFMSCCNSYFMLIVQIKYSPKGIKMQKSSKMVCKFFTAAQNWKKTEKNRPGPN